MTIRIRKSQYERTLNSIQGQVESIAASFGWDPRASWVQELKHQLPLMLSYFESWPASLNASHQMTYMVYRWLDPKSYMKIDREIPLVTACYSNNTDPDPLEVFEQVALYRLDQRDIVQIVIGSHRTSVVGTHDTTMVEFDGYGRKMHYSDSFRAHNAQQLVKELLNLELKLDEITLPDMQHWYQEIILERGEQGWQQKEGQTVRA